ncbi:hypothetical protein HK103_006509 [Boothiomyces macroporosus]|uniref:Uncharacterized protein n=1 Tax=Boothiomyces macroporosus TaxID=261099 RepID=A0AAD5UL74_9FUNG|nr:hypothetical protein HK103_006509 [Boothiomyces macroporosus]
MNGIRINGLYIRSPSRRKAELQNAERLQLDSTQEEEMATAMDAIQIPLIYMHSHHPTKPLENICKDPQCPMNRPQSESGVGSSYISEYSPHSTESRRKEYSDRQHLYKHPASIDTMAKLEGYLNEQSKLLYDPDIFDLDDEIDVQSSISQQDLLNQRIERDRYLKDIGMTEDLTETSIGLSTANNSLSLSGFETSTLLHSDHSRTLNNSQVDGRLASYSSKYNHKVDDYALQQMEYLKIYKERQNSSAALKNAELAVLEARYKAEIIRKQGGITSSGLLSDQSHIFKQRAAEIVNRTLQRKQEIKKSIDFANFNFSVSPGDSFYHYVNGAWLIKNSIPPDHSTWGTFEQLHRTNKALAESKMDILNVGTDKFLFGEDKGAQVLYELYQSAMDVEAVEKFKLQPIMEDLKDIESATTAQELFEKAGKLYLHGVIITPFYLFKFPKEKGNENSNVVFLLQDGLGLPTKEYYLSEQLEEKTIAYQLYIKKAFLELGLTGYEADIVSHEIFEFEVQLANISSSLHDICDPGLNNRKMSLKELEIACPSVPWTSYFEKADLPDSTEVIAEPLVYFKRLSELLSSTLLDSLKNYMKLKYITTAAPYLHNELSVAEFEFRGKSLFGLKEIEPRWKWALQLVCDIEDLINRADVEERSKAAVALFDIIRFVTRAFEHRLDEVEWLCEDSKKRAKTRLSKFSRGIGHFYDKNLAPLEGKVLRTNSLWENYKLIAKQIDIPVNFFYRSVDHRHTFIISNILKATISNGAIFPTYLAQSPFFYTYTPDKLLGEPGLNFGAIGVLYAHALLYSLDICWTKYDKNGEIVGWLCETDRPYYQKQIDAVVAQYNSYHFNGEQVNGILTASNNLADLGAISIAYKALQDFKEEYGEKVKPSTYLFTIEQEFFISWAQVCRNLVTEEQAQYDLSCSYFAPREWRVNGPLSNFKEFYEAFNVKPGDRMYLSPDKRVYLW